MAAPYVSFQFSVVSCQKAALRERALALRATCDPGAGGAAGRHILDGLSIPAVVAGVWPLPGEMDLRPLMAELHARGHRVLLPETPPRGNPLIFRLWTPTTPMLPERFGTLRPDGPPATPDLILVPLLAFDRQGHRLGYGGGYYDRTLAALPHAPPVGFGFAALEVDNVPHAPHDAPLAAIATEHGLIFPDQQAAFRKAPLRKD